MEESPKNAIGVVVCAALAVVMKSNYLIVCIAMIIYAAYKAMRKKNWQIYLTLCIVMPMAIWGSGEIIDNAIYRITDIPASEGIPMTSYIAMGLQDNAVAPGWYMDIIGTILKSIIIIMMMR